MSLLEPSRVEPNKSLAGTEPADADIASWKDGNIGLGLGTDSSAWLMYKQGAVVKFVALTGVPQ